MNRIYLILFRMVPGPRNEWIRAHHAELENIPSGRQRWRWTLGLLPLALSALARHLRHEAGTFLGGTFVKTIVATASILNLTAGAGLLVLFTIETGPPLVVLVLAVTLLIQGGYTLTLMFGAFGSHQYAATHLQLAGSTLALIAGTIGFATGFLANINPANNDPEYGPMSIAAIIAVHAIASLLAFTSRGNAQAQPSTP